MNLTTVMIVISLSLAIPSLLFGLIYLQMYLSQFMIAIYSGGD